MPELGTGQHLGVCLIAPSAEQVKGRGKGEGFVGNARSCEWQQKVDHSTQLTKSGSRSHYGMSAHLPRPNDVTAPPGLL